MLYMLKVPSPVVMVENSLVEALYCDKVSATAALSRISLISFPVFASHKEYFVGVLALEKVLTK